MSDKQTNKRNKQINETKESDLSDSCLSQEHPSPSLPAQVQISKLASPGSKVSFRFASNLLSSKFTKSQLEAVSTSV